MPCAIALIGLLSPRLLILVLGIFTHWFSDAHIAPIWAIVGFLFAPWTTLIYMAAMFNNNNEVSGIWIVFLFFSVLVDLASHGSVTIKKE